MRILTSIIRSQERYIFNDSVLLSDSEMLHAKIIKMLCFETEILKTTIFPGHCSLAGKGLRHLFQDATRLHGRQKH